MRKIYEEKFRKLEIIFFARNLAKRVWFHLYLKRHMGKESLDFVKAIDSRTIEYRLKKGDIPVFDHSGFSRNFDPIRAYRQDFEQAKVILFEDLRRNLSPGISEIFDFLGSKPFKVKIQKIRFNSLGIPRNMIFSFLETLVSFLKFILKSSLPLRLRTDLKYKLWGILLRKNPVPHPYKEALKDLFEEERENLGKLFQKQSRTIWPLVKCRILNPI